LFFITDVTQLLPQEATVIDLTEDSEDEEEPK